MVNLFRVRKTFPRLVGYLRKFTIRQIKTLMGHFPIEFVRRYSAWYKSKRSYFAIIIMIYKHILHKPIEGCVLLKVGIKYETMAW